jgi:EamA domain-containing membrane protein RarD
MRLIVAHKILISTFLVLCAILLVRGVRMYAAIQSTSDLVLGIAAAVVGVGLSFYLRRIWSR